MMDIHSAVWRRDASGIKRLRSSPGEGLAHSDPFTLFEQLRQPVGGALATRPCRGR